MYRDKVNRKSNIASIVELFLMFLLLLAVIVVITLVFMTTREQSLYAGQLTDAVICAENTAEITRDARNADEAADLIGQMEGVTDVSVDGNTVKARQDDCRIELVLKAAEDGPGTYVDEQISIQSDKGQELYRLQTGSYIR